MAAFGKRFGSTWADTEARPQERAANQPDGSGAMALDHRLG